MEKEIPVAKTFRLGDLVEYQSGSVVSRTLRGGVTVFAFDEGEGLDEHTAPHDALVSLLEGRAEIDIEGRTRQVADGESVILPAARPHAVRAVGRFKMLLVMLRG